MKKARTITGIIASAVALAGAIACGTGGSDDTVPPYATIDPSITVTATTSDPDPEPTTDVPTVPTTEPAVGGKKAATTKPSPTKTIGSLEEANAIKSATSYLTHSFFSRKGLIGQLEYEGYGKKAATAAVDFIGMDWNIQAAGTAATYLKHSSFSKKGLIEQLEYEGFTHKQAVYGVSKTGL